MKIIITYAYAGIGHKKAAEGVRDALRGFPGLTVKTIDVLDYTDNLFRFLYPRVYLFLINRAPLLWGFLYYFFDCALVDSFVSPIRRVIHCIHARKFIKFVLAEKPDVIFSTHFLPSEVVSELKRKNIFKGRLITSITDFLPHAFWIARQADYFIAAAERTEKDLIKRGIKEDRIRVLGIPSGPKFSVSKGRNGLIKKLGLEKEFFNVLLMSGGFGTGPIERIVYSIGNIEAGAGKNIQIVVICGKNKNLFERLNRIKADLKVRLKVFSYLDNVDEFMEIADCIITKSGGLTVSEALSKKLPMIIIRPIPGQETKNCKLLTGYGLAVRANSVKDVKNYVMDFMRFPEKIIGMKARINLLSFPDAARDIAGFIVKGAH